MDEPVKKTFTEHVLNFDDATKCEMMNIGQYVVLAIIPVLLLNKFIQVYSPDADDTKHSAEISLEIIAQVIVLFIGMMFIHRLITFVPTYSGEEYPTMNVLTPALSFLVIVLSIQSRLGEKVNILYERVMDVIGYGGDDKKQGAVVKTSQPIVGTPMHHQHQGPIQQPSSHQLPSYDIRGDAGQSQMPAPQPQMQQAPQQPSAPDYSMPMDQQQDMFNEPMAANDALGSGFGVSF